MFVNLQVGNLTDALTGRTWDRQVIGRELRQRQAFFRDRGVTPADRVFLHHGNSLEFFVDLLALWSLGGCAVPIDPRLTRFEVETLARTARPRLSLWPGEPSPEMAAGLAALGVSALPTLAEADAPAAAPPVAT